MAIKKDIPICEECVGSAGTKGLVDTDFYWIKRISQVRENHEPFIYNILNCINCIDKYDKEIIKPYKVVKKKGRPKKNNV